MTSYTYDFLFLGYTPLRGDIGEPGLPGLFGIKGPKVRK